MSIPKCLEFADYSHYPSDENPTTDSEMQVFMANQNELAKELAFMLWQPQTSYVAGQVIHSSSMPAGAQAIVTVAGTSDTNEPQWTNIGTIVTDGSVTYTMINIVTTINVTGNGNAVTSVTNNNGTVTLNKGATYLTTHQDISGKADKVSVTAGTAGTSSATSGKTLAVPYVTVNAQGLVTKYGVRTHTISGFLASDGKAISATSADSATKANLSHSVLVATCSTASGGATTKTAHTATCSGFSLVSGCIILVNKTGSGGFKAGQTLNVNSTGAKAIRIFVNPSNTSSYALSSDTTDYYYARPIGINVNSMTSGNGNAYGLYLFRYDGTYWCSCGSRYYIEYD